ncbi:MAG: hypothetical protein P4L10_10990 [Acidobacteriaceae bacterium]|nr:hypothetical protein [Acidobacteriaceae bacterium]
MNLVPGDIVVHGGETGVVWSAVTRTVIVLPAEPKRGASRSSDVDLGVVPISTIAGPMRVSIYERTEWPLTAVRVGHLNQEQQSAMRLTMLRCQDNRRVEASVRHSEYAGSAISVRSGGRRVGSKVMA